jgi:hypothetical protein
MVWVEWKEALGLQHEIEGMHVVLKRLIFDTHMQSK